jgi:predicted transcriptional regulator
MSGKKWVTLASQILAFLKGNQKPFTVNEILSGLGYSNDLNLKNLMDLVKEGTVEAKTIKQPTGVQVYYKGVYLASFWL